MSPRKVPPPIPVVGGQGGGDTSREQQLREWEQAQRSQREQQAAAVASALPVAPALVPVQAVVPAADPAPGKQTAAAVAAMPDPDSAPADQLVVCERGIHGAKARWKEKVDAATEEFIEAAGPYLCWVHEHKLYKLMRDNSGKLYRSFPKYLKEQHDLTERTGYRITQTIPILGILRADNWVIDDLSARQVDALHPVRLQHGNEAVVRVWSTASETKKGAQPTPDELEKAKVLIGLSMKPDPDEVAPELLSAVADPGAVVERATKLLVPDTVRAAVQKDPERVRHLVRVLSTALTEAGVPVD